MAFRKRAKKAAETFHFEENFEERGGTMGLAEGMRNLAQEIASSFDDRVAGVAARRREVAAKLKGFQQEMKDFRHGFRRKAAELRRFLRAGHEARSRQVSAMLAGFQRILVGFRQESHAAASHWHNMAAALAKKRASFAR